MFFGQRESINSIRCLVSISVNCLSLVFATSTVTSDRFFTFVLLFSNVFLRFESILEMLSNRSLRRKVSNVISINKKKNSISKRAKSFSLSDCLRLDLGGTINKMCRCSNPSFGKFVNGSNEDFD